MAIADGLVRVFRANKGEYPAWWAVRAPQGGTVYGKAYRVVVAEPQLVVRRENWSPGVKGTHAWVLGFLVDWDNWKPGGKPRTDIVKADKYGKELSGVEKIPMQYNLDKCRFEPEGLEDQLKFVEVVETKMFGYV